MNPVSAYQIQDSYSFLFRRFLIQLNAQLKKLIFAFKFSIINVGTIQFIRLSRWRKRPFFCKSSISSRVYRDMCVEIWFFLCFGLISVPGELHKPPFFSPILLTWPVSVRQMGEGCICMFRGQARPAQQGSSSHQRLTSTSSSGHVQRYNPSLLLLPLSWHYDMTVAHRPHFSTESVRFFVSLYVTCICVVSVRVSVWCLFGRMWP